MPDVLISQSVILYAETAQPKVKASQAVVLFGDQRQPKVNVSQSVVLYAEGFFTAVRESQVFVEIGVGSSSTRLRDSQAFVDVGVGGSSSRFRDSQVIVDIGVGLWSTTTSTTTTTTLSPVDVKDVIIGPPTTTTTSSTTSTTEYVPPTTTTSTTTSTTEYVPPGTTTTTTTSTTAYVPPTTTTTTTTTTTAPPYGLEWGEKDPGEDVEIYGWTEWKLEDGSGPTLNPPLVMGSGVADWGKLILYPSEQVLSSVKTLPPGYRTIVVEKDRYGYCVGDVSVWVRGSSTSFDWDAVSPSWSLYTGSFLTDWDYMQLKVEGNFVVSSTTTTTSTSTTSTTTSTTSTTTTTTTTTTISYMELTTGDSLLLVDGSSKLRIEGS